MLYGLGAFFAQLSGTPSPGLSFPPEVIAVAAGLWAAPWLLRGYGPLARSMLAPSRQAELAQRVRDLARTRAETLDAVVTDNGCGGAGPARGAGLPGNERRLAAFDGVPGIASPAAVTMEIPCALS